MLTGEVARSALALLSAAMTFAPVMERCASSHTHSRVNGSTTVRMRRLVLLCYKLDNFL